MKLTGLFQHIQGGPDPVDTVYIDARTSSVSMRNLQRCNGFDFNQKPVVQMRHRHDRPGRPAVTSPVGIDCVEGWPVVNVGHVHAHLHQLRNAAASGHQCGFDIGQNLPGLHVEGSCI